MHNDLLGIHIQYATFSGDGVFVAEQADKLANMVALAERFNAGGLGDVIAVRLAFYDRDGMDEISPSTIVPAFAKHMTKAITGCDTSVYRDGSYRPSRHGGIRRIFAIGYNEAACAFNSVLDIADENTRRGQGHEIYWVEDAVGSVSPWYAAKWTDDKRHTLALAGVRFIKTSDVPRLAVGNP